MVACRLAFRGVWVGLGLGRGGRPGIFLRDWNHDIPPSHHITFLPLFRDSLAGCSGQEAAPLHSHLSAEDMGSITDYIVQCREIYYIGKKPAAAVVHLGHAQPGGRGQAVIIPPFSTELYLA